MTPNGNSTPAAEDELRVCIVDRSPWFVATFGRMLNATPDIIDGGPTASIVEITERAIAWAANASNRRNVIFVRAEMCDGCPIGGPHQLYGIDVAESLQSIAHNALVCLFGVTPLARIERRLQYVRIPYVDFIIEGESLPRRMQSMLIAAPLEQPPTVNNAELLLRTATGVAGLNDGLVEALLVVHDDSAFDKAIAAALSNTEWADTYAEWSTKSIPAEQRHYRLLRSRISELAALSTVAQAALADRARLTCEWLERVETLQNLITMGEGAT